MINQLCNLGINEKLIFLLVISSFLLTIILIKICFSVMPTDQGKAFAVNGAISKGKPRGVGIVFILCFIIMSALFLPINLEFYGYLAGVFFAMLSGYLDDRSSIPWNEYKKGLIDLILALCTTGIMYFSEVLTVIPITGNPTFDCSLAIFISIVLIWVSINVTNCSDGVDGLCGSVSIITLLTCFAFIHGTNAIYSTATLIMVSCILGYLWFNVSPSSILMGDAGSRAIGYFIGILCLKFLPFYVYFVVAFVLLVDGGIGIFKVVLLRFFKIHILKNIQTPLHDFVRKSKGWSDGQVVFRFSLIQLLVSFGLYFWMQS
ncbi:MAG: phospho-N-acetylmuramoyl-pentapeptide-transferase [Lachnospiraceae bacterium]|nr:phospho-N-acetylmuramoyl-pentapeptide-transferase [Lachnospiraceae bacterium]